MSVSQPNAPDVWPMWRQFQPAATVAGAISGGPQYVTRQPFDSMTQSGAVLTLTTVKLAAGYNFFWNSQYNYKSSASFGTVIQTWFSPQWVSGDSYSYVNYLCQDTVGGTNGALTHTWVNQITTGRQDLNAVNSANGPMATTNGLMTQQAGNSVVIAGQPQTNLPDAGGFYSTSCYGARALYISGAQYLSDLKVGNSFTFNAGFKRFNNGVLVDQSKPATSLPTFVIVDVAAPTTTTTTTAPAIDCGSPNYIYNEALTGNKCTNNCQCDGQRTCAASGWCQGVARPTTTTTTTTTGTVSTPGPTTAMPTPADPAPIWYAATKGNFQYTIATPTSYVIQPFSTTVGTGLSATINTMKASGAYALLWNVQANYMFPADQTVVQQIWFSPQWLLSDQNQFVNFMCTDTIGGVKGALSHSWAYSQTYGQKDINAAITLPSDTTAGLLTLSDNNIWMFGQGQANNADANGWYSANCMGGRPNTYTSQLLSAFKLGTTVSFKAGTKFFCNGKACAQTSPTANAFTYTVVESGTGGSSTVTPTPTPTPTPVTPTTSTMPVPVDASPIWYKIIAASWSYTLPTPSSYVIQPFSGLVGTGVSATINTMKASGSYAFFWNVQANYQYPADQTVVQQIWFSPRWLLSDSTAFVNFLCTDTIGGVKGALTHSWAYSQTYGARDINAATTSASLTTSGLTTFSDTNIWMYGQGQANTADAQGWFSASCMGGRPNNYNSALLQAFKLGTTVSFRAGAKFFCNGVACAQTAVTTSDFVYTVVESGSTTTTTPTTPTTPTVSTTQPTASDASLIWYNVNKYTWSYTIATPTQYTIQPFSGLVGGGLVATINTMKASGSYAMFWNVQVNHQAPVDQTVVQQIWFSPQWLLSDSTAFVNFMCTDTITGSKQALTHNWQYSATYGAKDINAAATTAAQTAAGLATFSDTNIWQLGQGQANSPDANGWYSASCLGGRPNTYTSQLLSAFKLGTTIQFRAGYKLFCNQIACSQSAVSSSAFTFTVVDSGSGSSTVTPTTPTFVVSPVPSTAAPAPKDSAPIWYSIIKGNFNYTLAAPNTYTVSNYTNSQSVGISATLNTMKVGTQFAVFWNVQANYLSNVDQKLSIWFSPQWISTAGSFANFLCVDSISGTSHSWQYSQNYGTGSAQSGTVFTDTNIWMAGVAQQSQNGWYTANCMGGRPNNYNSALLTNFKVNDKVTFKAGVQGYCAGQLCVSQNTSNVFTYQIVDGTAPAPIPFTPSSNSGTNQSSSGQPNAVDASPIWYFFASKASGPFNFTLANPKQYNINNFDQKYTNSGLVATLNTMKSTNTYALFWDVQLNTKTAPKEGNTYQIWFSPLSWYLFDQTQYANFICLDQIVWGKHTWTYTQTASKNDLNGVQNVKSYVDTTAGNTQFMDQNVWMMGSNFTTYDGWNTMNCMGGRGNNYVSNMLVPFKVGTEIKFRAGYKSFTSTGLLANSYQTYDAFKYTVVDSALNQTGTSIFGPAFDDFVSIFTPSIGDYFGYIPADYTTGIVKELVFSNYTAPQSETIATIMDLAQQTNLTIPYNDLVNLTSSNLNNTVDTYFKLGQTATLAGFQQSGLDDQVDSLLVDKQFKKTANDTFGNLIAAVQKWTNGTGNTTGLSIAQNLTAKSNSSGQLVKNATKAMDTNALPNVKDTVNAIQQMLNGLTGGYFTSGPQNTATERKTERPPVNTSGTASSSGFVNSPADPFSSGFATPDVSPQAPSFSGFSGSTTVSTTTVTTTPPPADPVSFPGFGRR